MPSYTIRSRLIAIGRDYDVRDEAGEVAFKLDGKLRFARTFVVKDHANAALLRVREKLLCLDPTFVIRKADGGDPVANVRRTTPSGKLTTKFAIEANGETLMTAQGRFLTDGFEIRRAGASIGSVSRQRHTAIHEIFHMTASASEDQPLLIAIAMSIVEMCHHRGEEHAD